MTDKESKRHFEGLNRKPKTKKGWQEWNRKYALAFLHDQLDRVHASVTKKNYILSLLNKWEMKFRKELTYKIICETYAGGEGDMTTAYCSELREDHINVIAQYVACALCAGLAKENIARIRHFLKMQTVSSIRERMELRFFGGNPVYFHAYVDCLKDIDIADILFITEFESVLAYQENRKSWTKSTAKRFLDGLKKDVMFDMPGTVISANIDNAIGCMELEISIKASEDELRLKAYQCLPQSFIKRFGHP